MRQKAAIALAMLVVVAGVHSAVATTKWYYISFDDQGQLAHQTLEHPQWAFPIPTSGGDGEGWYYYPASDRYIMWFHTGPYSTNHTATLDLWTFVAGVDFSRTMSYDISAGWTTPAWTNSSSPPRPADMQTSSEESALIVERSFGSGHNLILGPGTIERNHTYRTDNYNPEWAFVSVSGRNSMAFRWMEYETIPKQGGNPGGDPSGNPGGDPGGTPPTVTGACCNGTLGECYMTDEGTCGPGFTYLGDESSCTSCATPSAQLEYDYGDAPDSYGVRQINNGASHTIVPGVHLGQGVSGEFDGQPGAGATGDAFDDGVIFPETLERNQPVTVTVTASTFGIINGWIDLNRDGDWDDPGEQIFADRVVTVGQNVLSFTVPATIGTGESYARIRYNTTGGLWHSGPASDGEVEDYLVTLRGEGQAPIGLAPVPPSHALTNAWRQPARRVDALDDRIDGWEIDTSWTRGPLVVDDWTQPGPEAIQGFRWWGVFDLWNSPSMPPQLPSAFHVSIWSNRPDTGMPDVLLWERTLPHWVWAYSGRLRHALGQVGDEAVFEFIAMLPQDQWFLPEEDPDARYWIGFSALYEGVGQPSYPWAWLTRQPTELSPAVTVTQIGSWTTGQVSPWPPTLGQVVLGSQPMATTAAGEWDMAFELIGHRAASSNGPGLLGDLNGDGLVNQQDQVILRGLVAQ